MTGLTKSYLVVLFLLGVGLALVLVDGAAGSFSWVGNRMTAHQGADHKTTALAALPGSSLAVPYFESRWRMLDNGSGALFPGMRPLSTMDFVYAQ